MFILLLFFIICLVLFLRELYSIKEDIEKLNKDLKMHIEEMNNQLRNKLQNDLGVCVNKIKTLNNDSIQQIRKINVLNNQPIKNSNHFTESDSLVNVEHEIHSLTEMKNCSPGINTIQDLTLHESNIKKNESDTSSLGINLTTISDSDTTENYIKTIPKMITTILLQNPIPVELKQPEVIITEVTNDVVVPEENKFEEAVLSKTANSTAKEIITTPPQQIEKKELINDKKILDLQNRNNKNMESLKIEIDNEHDSDSLISLTSSKSNNIPEEHFSLLQPIERYSYDELKTIAKCNNISISVMLNGKRKLFNKNELYNELDTKLSEKHKSDIKNK